MALSRKILSRHDSVGSDNTWTQQGQNSQITEESNGVQANVSPAMGGVVDFSLHSRSKDRECTASWRIALCRKIESYVASEGMQREVNQPTEKDFICLGFYLYIQDYLERLPLQEGPLGRGVTKYHEAGNLCCSPEKDVLGFPRDGTCDEICITACVETLQDPIIKMGLLVVCQKPLFRAILGQSVARRADAPKKFGCARAVLGALSTTVNHMMMSKRSAYGVRKEGNVIPLWGTES